MTGLLNDPVLLLGLMAFGALLLALPLAFWNLSGEPRSSTSRVVQLLVVAANLLLTAQLLWRWLDVLSLLCCYWQYVRVTTGRVRN